MTRRQKVSALHTLFGIAAVAALTLPLSACVSSQVPDDASTASKEPSAEPTAEQTDAADTGGMPETLSFADGQDLPDAAYIQWGDGLVADDGWKVASGDDGQGNWSYATVDDTCTAYFSQSLLGNIDVSSRDDSLTSDALLATLLNADVSQITPAARTGAFNYQVGGAPEVENRLVVGAEGDRSWIMAARAFSKPGVGLSVVVDCTGVDAQAAFDEVVEKSPIVVTSS